MPNAESIRMEDVSEAYVRALCAVNGYSITKSNHDNDGYDIEVECKGQVASDSLRYSPMVQMQLKASYAKIKEHPDGSITYPLEVKNYKWLIEPRRMTPMILVVFSMHQDRGLWVQHTNDYLKITKRAYWISLRGRADTQNAGTINITIPATNILTQDSLREIMLKISKGEEL